MEAPAGGKSPGAGAAAGGWAWGVVFHFFLVSREQIHLNPAGAGADGESRVSLRRSRGQDRPSPPSSGQKPAKRQHPLQHPLHRG